MFDIFDNGTWINILCMIKQHNFYIINKYLYCSAVVDLNQEKKQRLDFSNIMNCTLIHTEERVLENLYKLCEILATDVTDVLCPPNWQLGRWCMVWQWIGRINANTACNFVVCFEEVKCSLCWQSLDILAIVILVTSSLWLSFWCWKYWVDNKISGRINPNAARNFVVYLGEVNYALYWPDLDLSNFVLKDILIVLGLWCFMFL